MGEWPGSLLANGDTLILDANFETENWVKSILLFPVKFQFQSLHLKTKYIPATSNEQGLSSIIIETKWGSMPALDVFKY